MQQGTKLFLLLNFVCFFSVVFQYSNAQVINNRQQVNPVINPNPGIKMFSDEIKELAAPTDFIIIGSSRFASIMRPYVVHKNQMGIHTRYIDLESILQFNTGDDPARVKQAIAYAYINKSTRYVMLVGDATLFPVRHRFVNCGNEFGRPKSSTSDWWYDGAYVAADLYYASLFHHSGGNFQASMADYDDWDLNKNFKYDEELWNWNDNPQYTPNAYNPDKVDGYPDLAVGRLPIQNENDLMIYIDKAIKYDNGQMLPRAKKGITIVAGGSYPTSDDLCEQLLQYNSINNKIGEDNLLKFGFDFADNKRTLKSGWENGNFASVRNAVMNSWGLVYLGHGYNGGWDIHDNGSIFDANEVEKFIGQLTLPVVFSIGCETGQYKPVVPAGPYNDVYGRWNWYYQYNHDTICKKSQPQDHNQPGFDDRIKNLPIVINAPAPYDLPDQHNRTFACPWLFQKNKGGAIAFFGETVVCQNNHGRDLIERALNAYYNETHNKNIFLGDVWLKGQQQFWRDFRNDNDVFQNPRIYLSIMTFFGDPTLRMPAE